MRISLGEGTRKETSVREWTVTLIWLLRNYVCGAQNVCTCVGVFFLGGGELGS